MSMGRPTMLQCSVMLCSSNLSSLFTCRLNSTTARAPPARGAAHTYVRGAILQPGKQRPVRSLEKCQRTS